MLSLLSLVVYRNERSEEQQEIARRMERNFSIRRHISVESDMQVSSEKRDKILMIKTRSLYLHV